MAPGPTTRLTGLIGNPVSHSLSPMIHNTALEAARIDAVYAAFNVESESLGFAVRGLRALGFLGANVTIPHKRAVTEHLDHLSRTARMIGAVNTITIDRSGDRTVLRGENTDAEGFARPLSALVGNDIPESVLILGAGGAARAVTYACSRILGISIITAAARRPDQAGAMLREICPETAKISVVTWSDRQSVMTESELIVNATPIGMEPDSGSSPVPETGGISSEHIVYDLVYAPGRTRLIRDCSARGARTIGGLEMLIAQAAASFELWTGRRMPVEIVRGALSRHISDSE